MKQIIRLSLPLVLLGIVLSFYCACSAILSQNMFCSSRPSVCKSEEENSQTYSFAKAKDNCTLFLSPSGSTEPSNVLFNIPSGYFVRLLESASESTYKVMYADRVGYVFASSVKRVSIEPQTQCLNPITLNTKDGSGTILRKHATTNSDQVALVPAGSEILYIASAFGDKPTDGLSHEWYFVQYFPASEPTIYHEGYIYSERISSAPQIPVNAEDDPIIPLPTTPQTENILVDAQKSPTWLKALLITVLCLPAVLFIFYLCAAIVKHKRTSEAL